VAPPQSADLRKDEPHPMRTLFALPQFLADFRIHGILCLDEAFQIKHHLRLNTIGIVVGPCDQSPDSSPLSPSEPLNVPDTARDSNSSRFPSIVPVLAGISILF